MKNQILQALNPKNHKQNQTMPFNILQWNLNGLNRRLEFLQLLIKNQNPEILCLQETNFKESLSTKLKNYSIIFKNRLNTNRASGGVAIYTKNDIYTKEIQLTTNLEAVATKILLQREICICNVYIPNNYNFNLQELQHLINQLPKPFILTGDFNSHNNLWGSSNTDSRGKIIDKLLEDPEILLLNNTQPTHFNIANGTFSAIDLSFSSASIGHHLNWQVIENLYNSDHFPILINFQNQNSNEFLHEPTWKFKKANWEEFTKTLERKIDFLNTPSENYNQIDKLISNFTNAIIESADLSIPKTSNKSHKKQVPWWNEAVEKAIKDKKHAYNSYKKHKTEDKKIQFKKHRATARKICKTEKKRSWTEFISSITQNTPSSTVWKKSKASKDHQHLSK